VRSTTKTAIANTNLRQLLLRASIGRLDALKILRLSLKKTAF
jgi:hypothetical protein